MFTWQGGRPTMACAPQGRNSSGSCCAFSMSQFLRQVSWQTFVLCAGLEEFPAFVASRIRFPIVPNAFFAIKMTFLWSPL